MRGVRVVRPLALLRLLLRWRRGCHVATQTTDRGRAVVSRMSLRRVRVWRGFGRIGRPGRCMRMGMLLLIVGGVGWSSVMLVVLLRVFAVRRCSSAGCRTRC